MDTSIYTTQPYTYLIGWTEHNKWYYGVRYAEGCAPSDLWVKYFTSSKIVAKFRESFGEPDVIQIRKIFESKEKAAIWESKFLVKVNAASSEKWLNRNNNDGKFFNKGGYRHTQKSIENYKKSFDLERRLQLSNLAKNQNSYISPESRKKAGAKNSEVRKANREKYIGKNNPLFKRQRTEIEKSNISAGTKEAMNSIELREKLSEKAKLRCTKEWRESKAENNKQKICCIKCHKEMSKCSLGVHLKGRRCN